MACYSTQAYSIQYLFSYHLKQHNTFHVLISLHLKDFNHYINLANQPLKHATANIQKYIFFQLFSSIYILFSHDSQQQQSQLISYCI